MTPIIELLILLFVCISFLASGIDKVLDWKGQLDWFKNHFQKTILRPMIKGLLILLVALDFATGLLAIMGGVNLLVMDTKTVGIYALILGAITTLCMLFGQRIAKDYQGASSLSIYFLVLVFGLYVFLN